jgi:DNA-directed RNA polymerase specialized sigma24 family protein
MANATDLDIFTRSLSGDRRARTDLYRKFVHGSSRICRLGAGYQDVNDFLQDTFTNLLRTGHSWDTQSSLAEWVESVAVWTALQKDRQRDIHTRSGLGKTRMCAEAEGMDGSSKEVLQSYAPPLTGSDDSPFTRVLEQLTEPERTLLTRRAMEGASWEDTAAAAGKPLNTVGPMFARVVARITRLFGAPPPMDDDLVPVFERAAVDPGKPEGRAISIQLDTVFYAMTPEMRKIGLATSYDVRWVTLWGTAASSEPPGDDLRQHLDQCHYCADLLRALVAMQRGLRAPAGVDFLLCPGSFTLADSPDEERAAFDQHLAQCADCRKERAGVRQGEGLQSRVVDQAGRESNANPGAGKKIAVVAGLLLLLGGGSFGGYRYWAGRNTEQSTTGAPIQTEEQPTIATDPRYQDLVQAVGIEDEKILKSVRPENQAAAQWVISKLRMGDIGTVLGVSAQLTQTRPNDPAIRMLYAMSLRTTGWSTDAYREMLKSEALPPRDSFRCWVMFNFGVVAGEMKIMDREAEHLADDPEYGPKVRKTMEKVRER